MKNITQQISVGILSIFMLANQTVTAIPLQELSTPTKGLGIATSVSIVGTLAFAITQYKKLCKKNKAENKPVPTFIEFCNNNSIINKLLLLSGALVLVTGVQANTERVAYTKLQEKDQETENLITKTEKQLAQLEKENKVKIKKLDQEYATASTVRQAEIIKEKEDLQKQAEKAQQEYDAMLEEAKQKQAQILEQSEKEQKELIKKRLITENGFLRETYNLAKKSGQQATINTPSLAMQAAEEQIDRCNNSIQEIKNLINNLNALDKNFKEQEMYAICHQEGDLNKQLMIKYKNLTESIKILGMSLVGYQEEQAAAINPIGKKIIQISENFTTKLNIHEINRNNFTDIADAAEKTIEETVELKAEAVKIMPTIFNLPVK